MFSTRLGFCRDHTEPLYAPEVRVTVHAGSGIRDGAMVANLTCHGCRSYHRSAPMSSSAVLPMMFAHGPGAALSSGDLSASIRRHIAYGHFTADTANGTAQLVAGLHADGGDPAAVAHGAVFVIATLLAAPLDALVAAALPGWLVLRALTATAYVALVVGALVPGVTTSRQSVSVFSPPFLRYRYRN